MAYNVWRNFCVIVLLQVVVIFMYLGRSLDSTRHLLVYIPDRCVRIHRGNNESTERSAFKPEVFQPIDDRHVWLYSAFYDHMAAQRGRPVVRVFGLAKKDCILTIICVFSSETVHFTSTGVIIAMPGHHEVDYPPSYLECPLPSDVHPTHVSVSFQTKEKPTNRLEVLYPGPRIRNFTVCYSVLHSGFNKTTQLIENIEMNRILGAEHFMVYNYSISPEVDQILSRYQQDGLVTVHQWPIPTLESWYFAQMTALNDCFYRNRNTSMFVVVVDTDELIVPRYQGTWMELIDSVPSQETYLSKFLHFLHSDYTETSCFIAQTSFFFITLPPNWDSLSQFSFTEDEKKNIIKYNILTLSQVVREEQIYPHRTKSKYIARPEFIDTCGVHEVHQWRGRDICFNINEAVALTYHYRTSESHGSIVNDTSTIRFKQALYSRLMERIKLFDEIFL